MIFGVIQLIFSIILFGMLAGLLQGLTGNDPDSYNSINIAGKYMIWFGLLFAVFEFFCWLHNVGKWNQETGRFES